MDFEARHVTASERSHGADLGLVVRTEVAGELDVTKAALVQTKRLHPDPKGEFTQGCEFPKLFDTGSTVPPQWDRMLGITPASIYMLIGPDRLRIDRSIKDFGILTVDALRLKGMAAAGVHELSANAAYRSGRSLDGWMVDQFICCNTGDSASKVVETALGDNPDFPVRHAVRLAIRQLD